MTRRFAGWMLFAVVGCGVLPAAHAAEQGGQSVKQQVTSAASSAAKAPMAAPASQPAAAPINEATATQPATSPLEGTSWPVTVTPDAMAAQKGEKPFDDTLIFKDGLVTMSACVKIGFAASSYALRPAGETWLFTTQQLSKDQGTTHWEATFTGETVKGTLLWTKLDGTSLHYTFEGKKATTPGAS